jgi:hypothetical protein
MNVRWRGMRSRGPSSMGANVRWRARAVGGVRRNGHRGEPADGHGH